MKVHANAKLHPNGRLLMCQRVIEQGWLATAQRGRPRYNYRRKHGSLGHRPPAARLNELLGNNLVGNYS
jgi:hypothetical protein